MASGIAFDRPYRLSRLRAFPYDRFKIYTIAGVAFPYDRPDRLNNFWDDWDDQDDPDDHMETSVSPSDNWQQKNEFTPDVFASSKKHFWKAIKNFVVYFSLKQGRWNFLNV